VSQHHARIKNSREWKTARADCLDRDGHACIRCGETEGLEADHIVRLVDAPELAFDLENLQTLCTDCHDEKEREYAAALTERRPYVNASYPELKPIEEKDSEETVTLFL
jgi:5-methylcytosine-specific restriction endonuclease McrA